MTAVCHVALALAVALVLAGCGLQPASAQCPSPGETCPIPVNGEAARRAVASAAVCPNGAAPTVDERADGSIEWACAPADAPRAWRTVAGAVVPGWGVVATLADGALVVCDAAGRVVEVLPLVADDAGRYWHALTGDDLACLDAAACHAVSALCDGREP